MKLNNEYFIEAIKKEILKITGVDVAMVDSKSETGMDAMKIFIGFCYDQLGMTDQQISEIVKRDRTTVWTNRNQLNDLLRNKTFKSIKQVDLIYKNLEKQLGFDMRTNPVSKVMRRKNQLELKVKSLEKNLAAYKKELLNYA